MAPGGGRSPAFMPPSGSRFLHLVLFAVLTAACAKPGAAALTWTKTLVELDVPAGAAKAATVFPFRNTGAGPIRIAMVVASCDCITARPAKETYAPGETGEIQVVFDPTGLSGRVVRTIAIVTDDTPETPVLLTLKIQLPPPATGRAATD